MKIKLTLGDMSRIRASLKFAQEQHEALAQISVGDEREYHLDGAAQAQDACEKLRAAVFFDGVYFLTHE